MFKKVKYFDRLPGERKTFEQMMDKFMEEHAPKVSAGITSLNEAMKTLKRQSEKWLHFGYNSRW